MWIVSDAEKRYAVETFGGVVVVATRLVRPVLRARARTIDGMQLVLFEGDCITDYFLSRARSTPIDGIAVPRDDMARVLCEWREYVSGSSLPDAVQAAFGPLIDALEQATLVVH